MADKKISEMTPMIASEIANDDDIVISDTSANHTKRTPISELATFFGVNTEGIQDTVASMFTGGTMTGISATYDDPNGVMNFSLAGGVTTAEMGHLAGTTSDIQTQFNSKAPIASPTFTGTASAPTASANDNTTKIATTAYVQTELGAYGADTATFTNKSGNISQWTNNSGYITASSTDTLTNKSGNISQWTNNANYETPSSTSILTNKSINGSNNTITNIPYTALSAIADEDLTTVSGSHDTIPSAKATKDYVDTQISGIDSLAEANDSNISSPSSGQILVHDGVDSFDNQTSSVTLSGAVTGTANMDSSGDFAITTTIPTNTITINGQAVALGGSATIPSVLQSGGTFTGELHLNDNVTLSLGGTSGSGDLEILHDTNNSIIKNGTGELRVLGDTIKLKNNADNATFASFTNGGASELYHNNTKVLETTATGITVTSTVNGRNVGTDGTKLDTIANGAEVNVQANWSETDNTNDAFIQNKPSLATVATSGAYSDLSGTPSAIGGANGVHFNDNVKATFGDTTTPDFEIYHNGSQTIMDDIGTGSLEIRSNAFSVTSAGGSASTLIAYGGGAVEAYHNGSKKFATGSGGVDITGTITATTFDGILASGISVESNGWHTTSDSVNRMYFSNNAETIFNGTNSLDLRVNNTPRARIDSAGGWTVTGNVTAYGSISDESKKENIEIIPDALNKISQLRGVTFNYKKDGKKSTGLIAQDLEKVLPEVVYEATDIEDQNDKFKAVNYGNTVGLLVEAIKQLKERNEKLELIVNRLITEVEEAE